MSFRRGHGIALAELIVIGALGVTGLIISRPWFMIAWNSLPPVVELFLWYVLLTLWLYMVFTIIQYVSRGPISVSAGKAGGIRGIGLTETLALVTFFFAFFIVWNFFESSYLTDVLGVSQVPNAFLATEDGIVYMGWRLLGLSVQTAGFLTYVVTPMILALIAASLVGTKRYLQLLQMAGRG